MAEISNRLGLIEARLPKPRQQGHRGLVRDFLSASPKPLTATEIATGVRISNGAVRMVLCSYPEFEKIPKDESGTRVLWKVSEPKP